MIKVYASFGGAIRNGIKLRFWLAKAIIKLFWRKLFGFFANGVIISRFQRMIEGRIKYESDDYRRSGV